MFGLHGLKTIIRQTSTLGVIGHFSFKRRDIQPRETSEGRVESPLAPNKGEAGAEPAPASRGTAQLHLARRRASCDPTSRYVCWWVRVEFEVVPHYATSDSWVGYIGIGRRTISARFAVLAIPILFCTRRVHDDVRDAVVPVFESPSLGILIRVRDERR